jgi:hypothetical protein
VDEEGEVVRDKVTLTPEDVITIKQHAAGAH